MKLYQKLIYAIVLLLSFGAGAFIVWWNKPINEPLWCVKKGSEALVVIAKSLPYEAFWILVTILGCVAVGIPLWIIALRKSTVIDKGVLDER